MKQPEKRRRKEEERWQPEEVFYGPSGSEASHSTMEQALDLVRQMSRSELDEFVTQAIAERAKQQARSVSRAELELLLEKINRGLPSDLQMRLNQLNAKRRAETLTAEEHRDLLNLTDQVEALQAERIEALAQLARLRGLPLRSLMQELGIQAPDYA
jgi:hypothetical protein